MNANWPVPVYAGTDRLFISVLGPEIFSYAQAYCPRRTGRLANSIEYHMAGHSLIVAAHAPYAAYVELGTRPHVILPRNAQALRWYGPDGAVFAKRVNHPGTKPEPFLRRALYTVRAAAA
jgi:hypothetical protein